MRVAKRLTRCIIGQRQRGEAKVKGKPRRWGSEVSARKATRVGSFAEAGWKRKPSQQVSEYCAWREGPPMGLAWL